MGHLLLLISLLAAGATPGATDSRPTEWRLQKFAEGRAQVPLPASYHVTVAESGDLEAQTARKDGEIHLFIELSRVATQKDAGVAFVREMGKQKGIKVYERDGKVVLTEKGAGTKVGNDPVVNMHWQIGIANCLFVMTLSVREAEKESANVKRFFEVELERILGGLRLVGA